MLHAEGDEALTEVTTLGAGGALPPPQVAPEGAAGGPTGEVAGAARWQRAAAGGARRASWSASSTPCPHSRPRATRS